MDKKEEIKDLLEDKQLDKVTGAKISQYCDDGGPHVWDCNLPGEYFRTCIKCGDCAWITL